MRSRHEKQIGQSIELFEKAMNVDFGRISPEDFEYLCEDLLLAKGFAIESRPARGPDAGKDILAVRDKIDDMGCFERERWLVECKQFAVSGRAVAEGDTGNFEGRMKVHRANRYLLITSTTVTEKLSTQLAALAYEEGSSRRAVFWSRMDLLEQLKQFPSVRQKYFHSWKEEAEEAAALFQTHYSEVHRGAVQWCPGVVAIFGNDGYASNGSNEDNEATVRAHNEVASLRLLLANEGIRELTFATSVNGCTWVVLAATSDAYRWNTAIWTCYPYGASSNEWQKREALSLLWKFLSIPLKSQCALRIE